MKKSLGHILNLTALICCTTYKKVRFWHRARKERKASKEGSTENIFAEAFNTGFHNKRSYKHIGLCPPYLRAQYDEYVKAGVEHRAKTCGGRYLIETITKLEWEGIEFSDEEKRALCAMALPRTDPKYIPKLLPYLGKGPSETS